jgi:hypothetical protein
VIDFFDFRHYGTSRSRHHTATMVSFSPHYRAFNANMAK